MNAVPNANTPATIRRGSDGWPVFALQSGLKALGLKLATDGDFGPATEAAVRNFQSVARLVVDGIAGPATQAGVAERCERVVDDLHPGLPVGLVRGLAALESGGLLGAVNWSVAGGVDCGIVQRRVYGPPYGLEPLRAAYAPVAAMGETAQDLRLRFASFRKLGRSVERSWRLATLAHNWPYAADQLGRFGALPNPNGLASWVASSVRQPDGTPVRTRMEWCEFYALGGRHGEARATRFVEVWS